MGHIRRQPAHSPGPVLREQRHDERRKEYDGDRLIEPHLTARKLKAVVPSIKQERNNCALSCTVFSKAGKANAWKIATM